MQRINATLLVWQTWTKSGTVENEVCEGLSGTRNFCPLQTSLSWIADVFDKFQITPVYHNFVQHQTNLLSESIARSKYCDKSSIKLRCVYKFDSRERNGVKLHKYSVVKPYTEMLSTQTHRKQSYFSPQTIKAKLRVW